jgi:hypothetical protein
MRSTIRHRTLAILAVSGYVVLSAAGLIWAGRSQPVAYYRLSYSSAVDDSAVVGSLRRAGVRGAVALSTQWLYVNDFGAMAKVPLDGYGGRIAAFDPRDDGYAAELRAVFEADGRRVVFIPIDVSAFAFGGAFAVRRALDASGLPLEYRLDRAASAPAPIWAGIAGVAAVIVALVSGGAAAALAAAAPGLLTLALYGAPGLAAAGFLAAAVRAGRPLLKEWTRSRFASVDGSPVPAVFDRSTIVMTAVSVALALACALLGGVPWPLATGVVALNLAAVAGLYAAREARSRRRGHSRFSPLSLFGATDALAGLARAVLPFAAAALAAAVWSFGGMAAPSVDDGRYGRYLSVQERFWNERLVPVDGIPAASNYASYRSDDAGLIDGAVEQVLKPLAAGLEKPPYERLMAGAAGGTLPAAGWRAWLALGLIVAAAAPALAQVLLDGRRRRSDRIFADKRVAA